MPLSSTSSPLRGAKTLPKGWSQSPVPGTLNGVIALAGAATDTAIARLAPTINPFAFITASPLDKFPFGGQSEIGRASFRERVCQYVSISVAAGSLKKKN